MNPVTKQTDKIVSKFTSDILGLARKHGVDFATVGPKKTAANEIIKTMDV